LSYAGGIHKKARQTTTRESLFYRDWNALSIKNFHVYRKSTFNHIIKVLLQECIGGASAKVLLTHTSKLIKG